MPNSCILIGIETIYLSALQVTENKNLDLVVTAKEMAEIDRTTIEDIGIPGMVLMENAGAKIVAVIRAEIGETAGKSVFVACGKGNNGGDGYVVARYLLNQGAAVKLLLTADPKSLKGDAAQNYQILQKLGGNFLTTRNDEWRQACASADLIVDALLGTGVTGALKTELAEIVTQINQASAKVVAVDLPTGMNTDTGAVSGECVQADHTVTMGHLKRGLLFSPGREKAGKVHVADIGFPARVSAESGVKCYRTTEAFVRKILPQRSRDTFKNRCGQVFLLAGSVGMTGAATLSSEAAMRVGAGMALLGAPASLNPILEQKLTEIMTLPLPETERHSLSFQAIAAIEEKLDWATVLAVGPGLTTHPDSGKLVRWLLEKVDKPVVLDADGLNCLAGQAAFLKEARAQLVLTPHPGELSRLTGKSTKDLLADPISAASQAAADFDCVVILKGGPTVIAAPDGRTFINATGNSGMATAGMGDVLTGVIAGLAAQGLLPLDAAVAGVYLHGLAGDLAYSELGAAGLIAGDLLRKLPLAIQQMETSLANDIVFI